MTAPGPYLKRISGAPGSRPASRSPRAGINCRSCAINFAPDIDVTITFLPGDNYRHNIETADGFAPRRLQSGAAYRRARNAVAASAR